MNEQPKEVISGVVWGTVIVWLLILGWWTGIVPAFLVYFWHQTWLYSWWEGLSGAWNYYQHTR